MMTSKNKPSRTILCPTDFSTSSEQALCHAARHCGGDTEMIVLHIGTPGSGDRGTLLKKHLHHFSEHSDLLSNYGCNVRFAVEYGTPSATIIDYADRVKADMIVMGSHGESSIGRLLVGSTAEAVMRHAPCPVLVLRSPKEQVETESCQKEKEETVTSNTNA
ncbi:MAG TPA: universal stress protein [Chlorobaculum parvum]|uniref:Universal stress protein n=1 Tax=Chlorobaculum parvum TaxID=274539 RepID=A0A7C5DF99_9CHLB|nr:universal stress protein [Chlorobaculum parvum]